MLSVFIGSDQTSNYAELVLNHVHLNSTQFYDYKFNNNRYHTIQ